jgi:UDP-N-acetylmuramoylalanine--D-glutamate ligase
MKVAVIGFGRQGASATQYWLNLGDDITVCDQNADLKLPEGVKAKLGDDYLSELDQFDLIVRSPSVHPSHIAAANPKVDILSKVTTNTNEFFRICPTKNIIAVTGTKGKGTTSTLITNMLKAMGKRAHLGGNIGTPPLEMLKDNIEPNDWVVLELANFQLIDLKYSPPIAVCLMVVTEHQDWHTELNEYFEAKSSLFRWQTADDVAIFYAHNNNSKQIVDASEGRKIPYMSAPGAEVIDDKIVIDNKEICTVEDIRLPGKHSWQNICAAITAVWQVEQNPSAIRKAIQETESLPYRIELRREVNGVKFYNDSFATAPDATSAAVQAIEGKKVLIIGGYDRHLDLSTLVHTLQAHAHEIRKVVVIGQASERIVENFEVAQYRNYFVESSKEMRSIVETAQSFAENNASIIFSPGFASFDMFKNFEERGKIFNKAVEEL